jgi:hypothetical protein
LLRMTDTITSKNIDLSSWDILYTRSTRSFRGEKKLSHTHKKNPHPQTIHKILLKFDKIIGKRLIKYLTQENPSPPKLNALL